MKMRLNVKGETVVTKAKYYHQYEEELDLTPLMDVVFIVLIFFVVSTSFIKEAGLPLNKPITNTATPANKSLVLKVHQNGRLQFGGAEISLRSLKANLLGAAQIDNQSSIVIRVHPAARTKTVVNVLDVVKSIAYLQSSVVLM